jgi:hypothetical protein
MQGRNTPQHRATASRKKEESILEKDIGDLNP